jgi:hypothetical protein
MLGGISSLLRSPSAPVSARDCRPTGTARSAPRRSASRRSAAIPCRSGRAGYGGVWERWRPEDPPIGWRHRDAVVLHCRERWRADVGWHFEFVSGAFGARVGKGLPTYGYRGRRPGEAHRAEVRQSLAAVGARGSRGLGGVGVRRMAFGQLRRRWRHRRRADALGAWLSGGCGVAIRVYIRRPCRQGFAQDALIAAGMGKCGLRSAGEMRAFALDSAWDADGRTAGWLSGCS